MAFLITRVIFQGGATRHATCPVYFYHLRPWGSCMAYLTPLPSVTFGASSSIYLIAKQVGQQLFCTPVKN